MCTFTDKLKVCVSGTLISRVSPLWRNWQLFRRVTDSSHAVGQSCAGVPLIVRRSSSGSKPIAG